MPIWAILVFTAPGGLQRLQGLTDLGLYEKKNTSDRFKDRALRLQGSKPAVAVVCVFCIFLAVGVLEVLPIWALLPFSVVVWLTPLRPKSVVIFDSRALRLQG
jgi:hypothetical protein